MPNRIIKESAFSSDKIASLTDFEFRLWVGLITSVDDAGRGDARPAIIKGRVFALRYRVSVKDIDVAIHGLAAKGCISLYTVGGKSYFWFPTWGKHQRVRDVRPKYPAPEEADNICDAFAAPCGELPQTAALIQSESKSESESKIEANASCAEPKIVSAHAVFLLPLNDGTDYAVSEEQYHEWESLYPAVDVIQQLRNMKGWLDSNPRKRKTKRGVLGFITGWLSREQDRGGERSPKRFQERANVFMEIAREEGLV